MNKIVHYLGLDVHQERNAQRADQRPSQSTHHPRSAVAKSQDATAALAAALLLEILPETPTRG
jgi:hypothetical protein